MAAAKGKWFYPAQQEAFDRMSILYPNAMQCQWQIVTKDRVVEQWVVTDKDHNTFNVLLVITKGHTRYWWTISRLKLITNGQGEK